MWQIRTTKLATAIILVLVVLPLTIHGDEDSSENTIRVVEASEILVKIQNNESVEYYHVIVDGNLDLSELDLPTKHINRTGFENVSGLSETLKIVTSPIIIEDSTFNGFVHFNNAIFNEKIDFVGSNFTKDATFGGAMFGGVANFRGATFRGNTDFDGATFRGNTDFRRATFRGDAFFGGATFRGDAFFGGAEFRGDAYFEGAMFRENALFVGTTFSGDAYFSEAAFSGIAYFGGTTFGGDAYFRSSNFNITTNFELTEFSKNAILNDIVFKGNTSFNDSQFKEDALFENTTFRGNLSLTRARYNKLYIRWHHIKAGFTYDDAAYMSLMKNFKDLGYFEDYDSCYFQYRKEHRGQPWPLVSGVDNPIRKSIDFFLEWFYGYGTRPLNALYFSLAIIIIFGIFWKAIGLGGPDDVTGEESKVWERPDDILDIFGFSTTVFLSGTRLFIDPPDVPKIKGRSRSIVKKAFTFERILGALFSILFFLAISGTVVR
jgi:hypothetical protein